MAMVRPQLNKGPGVYLQEVPSGSHTVIGVPTSVTVFLGRTAWGPTDEPVTVTSFEDFETKFGGLFNGSPMTYAVQDFFLNGGATAVIVRLFEASTVLPAPAQPPAPGTPAPPPPAWAGIALIPDAGPPADPKAKPGAAPAQPATSAIQLAHLFAATAGEWGSDLKYFTVPSSTSPTIAQRFTTAKWKPTAQDPLFDLTITWMSSATGKQLAQETFQFVSQNPSAGDRYVGRVLELESSLAQLQPAWTTTTSAGKDSGPIADETYAERLEDLDKHVEVYNLLCIPPDQTDGDVAPEVLTNALAHCVGKRATLIVDPPTAWTAKTVANLEPDSFSQTLGISVGAESSRHAAIYYPRVMRPDPFLGGASVRSVACGAVAGVIARTDATRGVWKAPAGWSTGLAGVTKLAELVDDQTSDRLNSIGVNCLRSFASTGPVVWGARTARGSDVLGDDYKYLPVRRLTDYIENSLLRSTGWAVFEPNDEPLWSQLRLSVGGFMADLFRQGAFQGSSRDEAYFVKCDATTTTQSDIDAGIVNIQIGFAPLKPAEFVVLYLQQIANSAAT